MIILFLNNDYDFMIHVNILDYLKCISFSRLKRPAMVGVKHDHLMSRGAGELLDMTVIG